MSTVAYPCPNCGGELDFNPVTQKCECAYCNSGFTVPELEALRSTQSVQNTAVNSTAQLAEFSCPNCGAQVIADPNTITSFCVYCHNPLVMSPRISGEFAPQKVIPFRIDKKMAVSAFISWCKKKWFLPKNFTSEEQIQKLSGMYVPYWLFDCKTTGYMQGNADKIRTWSSGDYRYTKTDTYSFTRRAYFEFDNVPYDASAKLNDSLMQAVEPFNYKDLTSFSINYLPGFRAERYDLDSQQIYPLAEQRVTKGVYDSLYSSVSAMGYSSVSPASKNTDFHNVQTCYSLLPVWVLTYLYKEKSYTYIMNGQTGKTFGELPVSKPKMAILSTILTVATTIISFFAFTYFMT